MSSAGSAPRSTISHALEPKRFASALTAAYPRPDGKGPDPVTLAALIAAYHDADGPGGALRATLPLAGRTLIERQARLAAAAGADPILILVERVPPELVAAVDRMRAEGMTVAIARSVAEAAGATTPGTRLLLIADGLVADESHVTRLTAAGGAALLTVPDHKGDHRFERIDSQSLWGGLAVIDGAMLKDTAAMLGEWDLQSTLLRHAVQSGARQFAVRGEAPDDGLVIAQRAEDLAQAEAFILQGAGGARGSGVSRYLLGPVEQHLARALMPSALTPGWLYTAGLVLIGLSGVLFARGWLAAGVILFLLSTPLDGAAERLAVLRLQRSDAPDWWRYTLAAVAGMALAALGFALVEERGWGCVALVAATISFLVALHGETHGREIVGHTWLAEPKNMGWLMLPFALTGRWVTGLAALALYAAGSFFWAQRQIHRPKSAIPND